ncbi:MAG: hypothetical protein DRN20_04250 [Thermoplasmata archaeon]|nr:MAG: hypothetical protein DRN20_04250 [Thermoplasmata archaeon]
MITLSFTSATTYEICPLRYKFIYIDGLREKPTHYTTFGDVLHKCMLFFYSGTNPPTLEDLIKYYDDMWSDEGYDDERIKEYYYETGKKILTKYHEVHSKNYVKPLAMEKDFCVEYYDVKIVGRIDRISPLGKDVVEIVDYKTSMTKLEYNPNYSEQLILYQVGAEEGLGYRVGRLTIYHLPTLKAYSTGRVGDDIVNKYLRKLLSISHSIRMEEFRPSYGNHCKYCQFTDLCPMFSHMRDESEQGLTIRKIVDEVGELSKRKREIEERIRSLKAKIEEYAKSSGAERFYGEKYIMIREVVKRAEYDHEALMKILKPLGLWERVLRVDPKLVDEILVNADSALRDSIMKARKVKEVVKYVPREIKGEK